MNTDDKFFKQTVQILNNNNINFWLCHGTLLGIIRENRLLPWDHDIDFGIWSDEHSKEEILKIFSNNVEFQQFSRLRIAIHCNLVEPSRDADRNKRNKQGSRQKSPT